MQFDKQTIRYFKYKFFNGKNMVARFLDKLFGTLLAFILLFCLFWAMGMGLWRSVVLTVTVVAVFSLFRTAVSKYRLEKFMLAELADIRRNYMLEKLTLLSEEEFAAVCKNIFLSHEKKSVYQETLGGLYFPEDRHFCYAFNNHPENPVGVQQLLVLHRKLQKLGATSATVLSAAPYGSETSTMSKRLGAAITLLGRDAFFPAHTYYVAPPSQEELKKVLQAEISAKPLPGRIKNAFLSPKKSRAYISCAAFLLCWYLIAGFGILYPIAAAVCIVLAILSYLADKKPRSKITVQ